MIETVLRSHFFRYPSMRIQDVYKLLHQAALGSEHAVSSPESARNWLKRELVEMGEGSLEPLIDPLSPDGNIARIHLRPFMEAGHEPEALLDAFIRTANEHHGDVRLLDGFWQAATAMGKFPVVEMEEFIRTMREQSYPAVHHSSIYKRLYRPAYRVVALAFCPDGWL